MRADTTDYLDGKVVLLDPHIHRKAKVSREDFLEKVRHIRFLRTLLSRNHISFYITSLEEHNNLVKFHRLVNEGVFDYQDYYLFAVAIGPKLYDWFKSNTIETIQKQIVTWMASLYFFNPRSREIHKSQFYKPLYEEVQSLIRHHYHNFKLPDFESLNAALATDSDEEILAAHEECEHEYLRVCNAVYQADPPEFLKSPFEYLTSEDWGTNPYYNFDIVEAYLNENDWKNIIEKGAGDDMHRAESLEDLWLKWKHSYSTFDLHQNFVYSFFFEKANRKGEGKRERREKISPTVRTEVWNRDGGKCVQCFSNEKLEFDHIIPFSKGGASTFRNLQLLCERCNRKKSTKI